MKKTALYWLGHTVLAAAILTGCADESALGPEAVEAPQFAAALSQLDDPMISDLSSVADQPVDLGVCDNLKVPVASSMAYRVYAKGFQVYRWNGQSWSLFAPDAVLYADANYTAAVGTHYAGPTWESISGSKVVAAVAERCTPDPNSVQWLLLKKVSNEGPGIFERVAYIQRVNTAGGLPPAQGGSQIGEEARMPYTTEYIFYQAQ